jgi:hypothetical protein
MGFDPSRGRHEWDEGLYQLGAGPSAEHIFPISATTALQHMPRDPMLPTSVLAKAFPRARGYKDARPPATLVATGGIGLGGEWQLRADPVR